MTSCYTLRGHLGTSDNITESKKNGVFIYKLQTDANPYKINDTLAISIKEIWLENMWAYVGLQLKSKKVDGYQLCITLNSTSLKGYNDKWVIGNDIYSRFGEYSDSSLVIEFQNIPDTILIYKVYEGSFEFDSIGKELGQFVLNKKQ